MPATRMLPEAARDIVYDQSWDEDTQIMHLIGFIEANVPDSATKLQAYFAVVAAEENQAI